MTLRIVAQSTESGMVIVLHGRLSSAEVEELERVVPADQAPSRVDLAQLTSVDSGGLQALLRLRQRGGVLTGASPYVAMLLERTADRGVTEGHRSRCHESTAETGLRDGTSTSTEDATRRERAAPQRRRGGKASEVTRRGVAIRQAGGMKQEDDAIEGRTRVGDGRRVCGGRPPGGAGPVRRRLRPP